MSYSNYEQKIVLNGFILSGVQDVDGSYGINENPLRVAGVGFIDALIEAPLEGNFTISRDMVSRDPLIETNSLGRYTYDEDYVSGVILYDNDNKGFGFTKGRVSRYSVSCSAGEVPTINTDIRVFGELGQYVLSEKTISINTSFANYPFNGDYVYFTDLNGNVLDQGQNLKTEWDAGTLTIDDDQYATLSETSRLVEDGDVLGLGKNAFQIDSSYQNVVINDHPPIQFPDQSSISIDVDDFNLDAISDFSYSRTINMTPVYAIPKGTESDWNNGSLATHKNLEPIQVDTQYPIETDINFTMIVDKYEIRQIKDRIQSAPKSNVVINIRDAKTDNFINAFTGHNVRLISESINASIEGEMSISLTYKGYDTYHNPVT